MLAASRWWAHGQYWIAGGMAVVSLGLTSYIVPAGGA